MRSRLRSSHAQIVAELSPDSTSTILVQDHRPYSREGGAAFASARGFFKGTDYFPEPTAQYPVMLFRTPSAHSSTDLLRL